MSAHKRSLEIIDALTQLEKRLENFARKTAIVEQGTRARLLGAVKHSLIVQIVKYALKVTENVFQCALDQTNSRLLFQIPQKQKPNPTFRMLKQVGRRAMAERKTASCARKTTHVEEENANQRQIGDQQDNT